jgi:hypothetical protein
MDTSQFVFIPIGLLILWIVAYWAIVMIATLKETEDE